MQVFSFKRLKEERLRLQDEMDRGYFEDFKDLKKNQGKVRKHVQATLLSRSTLRIGTTSAKVVT
jgi:hypothetical protein